MSLKFKPRANVAEAIVLDYSPGPGSFRGASPVGPAGYWNRNLDGSYSLNPLYRPPTVPRTPASLPSRSVSGPGFRVVPRSRQNQYHGSAPPIGLRQSAARALARTAITELAKTLMPPQLRGAVDLAELAWDLWPLQLPGPGTVWVNPDGSPFGGSVFYYAPDGSTPYQYGGSNAWVAVDGRANQDYFTVRAFTTTLPPGITRVFAGPKPASNVILQEDKFSTSSRRGTTFDNRNGWRHFIYPSNAPTGIEGPPIEKPNTKAFPPPVPAGVHWSMPGTNLPGTVVSTGRLSRRRLLRGRGNTIGRDLHNPRPVRPTAPRPGPAVVTVTGPGGGGPPVKTVSTTPPPRQPPPRGTKEIKGTAAGALNRALRIALKTTEAVDLIDAVHSVLPPEFQASTNRPQDKLVAIATHWDKLNAADVIIAIATNEVQDRVIGRLSAAEADFMRSIGSLRTSMISGLTGF